MNITKSVILKVGLNVIPEIQILKEIIAHPITVRMPKPIYTTTKEIEVRIVIPSGA